MSGRSGGCEAGLIVDVCEILAYPLRLSSGTQALEDGEEDNDEAVQDLALLSLHRVPRLRKTSSIARPSTKHTAPVDLVPQNERLLCCSASHGFWLLHGTSVLGEVPVG